MFTYRFCERLIWVMPMLTPEILESNVPIKKEHTRYQMKKGISIGCPGVRPGRRATGIF